MAAQISSLGFTMSTAALYRSREKVQKKMVMHSSNIVIEMLGHYFK